MCRALGCIVLLSGMLPHLCSPSAAGFYCGTLGRVCMEGFVQAEGPGARAPVAPTSKSFGVEPAQAHTDRNRITRKISCALHVRGGGVSLQDWIVAPAQDLAGTETRTWNSKLHEAAEKGDVESIDRCLKAGAEVNARGPGLWSGAPPSLKFARNMPVDCRHEM